MKDDSLTRAVRKTKLPRRYVECVRELDRESGERRWLVRSFDPTGGAATQYRILTEGGELLRPRPTAPNHVRKEES